MELSTAIALVWIHFFADFVLQVRTIADRKSVGIKILLLHITLYGAALVYFGWEFAVVNAILHGVVDFFSSRLAKKFYRENKFYYFWLTIGADQALHFTCLFITYKWMVAQ